MCYPDHGVTKEKANGGDFICTLTFDSTLNIIQVFRNASSNLLAKADSPTNCFLFGTNIIHPLPCTVSYKQTH